MDKQLVRAVEENNIDRAANLLETGASVNALDVFVCDLIENDNETDGVTFAL